MENLHAAARICHKRKLNEMSGEETAIQKNNETSVSKTNTRETIFKKQRN